MKKHTATLLILMLVALAGLASAQTRTVVKANVPFAFVANGKTMPAGECTIEVQGNGQTILLINSGAKHVFATSNASESSKSSDKTSLVFHRYGDRYFLAAINRQGERRGYELPVGSLEVELRAQNVVESDLTLLASAK